MILEGAVILLDNMGHEAQVVLDQAGFGGFVPGGDPLEAFVFLLGCSNARSFDRPTVAKPGEKIKVPILIRRKGADVFRPAHAAGGSLMAYKCLSLCCLLYTSRCV